jgi:hypothetical protein
MDNHQKYNAMRLEIVKLIQLHTITPLDTFNLYVSNYCNFISEIKVLEQKYSSFNQTIIRHHHYLNPIPPTRGTMRYFEEIVGELWYYIVHILNTHEILSSMILKHECLLDYIKLEKEIVELFNPYLGCQNALQILETILEQKTYSVLDYPENLIEPTVELFYKYSTESTNFKLILQGCLEEKNIKKLELYFQLIQCYQTLEKDYYEILKQYFIKTFQHVKKLTGCYSMFQELNLYNTCIPVKLKKYLMKNKLIHHETELAVQIIQNKCQHQELADYIVNDDFFISELTRIIIHESIQSEVVYHQNLPIMYEKHYLKLSHDFKTGSFHYPKLFVFNDTKSYRIQFPQLIIPNEIIKIQKVHQDFYQIKYPNRKLTWVYEKSFVTVICNTNTFRVDFLTFMVLNLFNYKSQLTIQFIHQETGIPLQNIHFILKILLSQNILHQEQHYFLFLKPPTSNIILDTKTAARSQPVTREKLIQTEEKCKLEIVSMLKKQIKIKKEVVIEFCESFHLDCKPNKILNSLENSGYIEIQNDTVYYIP